MTEHKEEKLLRAIATPPVELPEESGVDESAELVAAPPLEPALRERLRAAVRAELAKDAVSDPEAMLPRTRGRQAQAVTPVPGGTMPSSPRYRAPSRRWWRPHTWFVAIGVMAAVATVVLMGPWGTRAPFPNCDLVIDHPGEVLGSSSSLPRKGTRAQEVEELLLEDPLAAELQLKAAVSEVPEVKVWVEQQGRLMPWPVSVELQSQVGSAVALLKSDRPLAELSSAGAKVSAGPATLLVAVGVRGKLPPEPEVAAWVGKEAPTSRSWRLIRQRVMIIAEGEGQ